MLSGLAGLRYFRLVIYYKAHRILATLIVLFVSLQGSFKPKANCKLSYFKVTQ